jgi:hypothetical protein
MSDLTAEPLNVKKDSVSLPKRERKKERESYLAKITGNLTGKDV